jgi:hypothetical protein
MTYLIEGFIELRSFYIQECHQQQHGKKCLKIARKLGYSIEKSQPG